jgi:hypothetical protein
VYNRNIIEIPLIASAVGGIRQFWWGCGEEESTNDVGGIKLAELLYIIRAMA